MGQQSEWGEEESRDLIVIRGEAERNLNGIKRNKRVWEIVSLKMRDKGHVRTPDQCKCKWKNLVNRYKNSAGWCGSQGKETSEPESGKQCPFFDELHEVFSERAKSMQPKSSRLSEDEEDESGVNRSNCRKRKAERDVVGLVKEMLEQQERMEMEWREMMERHACERMLFEQEWRLSMEKRERERLIAQQTWLEKEEQRRIREEKRAETRHALLTSLLTELLN